MANSKTLKCASCNIVICELLAYLQNKVDVMDNESMVRICASTYNAAEVEEAKSLLFDTIQTKRRNISRRKDGKIQRDLEDIIAVLKETDPDVVPIFVVRNLNKIPVACFDHLDPSTLLKDIVRLKADIQEIKQTYVTVKQFEDLDKKWANCQPPSSANGISTECRINRKRGAYLLDSGPMGFLTPRTELVTEQKTLNGICTGINSGQNMLRVLQTQVRSPSDALPSEQSPKATSGLSDNDMQRLPVPSPPSCSRAVPLSASKTSAARSHLSPNALADGPCHSHVNKSCTSRTKYSSIVTVAPADLGKQNECVPMARKLSFAELAGNGDVWIKPREDEKWIEVQRKRLRNKFVGSMGKAESDPTIKFKAADIKIPLFVSNVHKSVVESDIIDYIYQKTKEKVFLLKIEMKRQKDYNSYKIFVSKTKIDIFLDDKLWPSGISFRRFVSLKDWQGGQREIKQPITNNYG